MKLASQTDYINTMAHLTIVCQDFHDRWVNDTSLDEKQAMRVRVVYFFMVKAFKQLQNIDDDEYKVNYGNFDASI